MPNVRKLSQDEVRAIENKGKGQRKLIEEQYDEILGEYGEGDYGEALLDPGENRLTVRNRLKAAARRRNLTIDFRRTKDDLLRFQVTAAAQAVSTDAPEAVAPKGRGRKKKNA
ncbi:MAG TPA: hypothetical protein PLO33_08335 [Kouleothrix sp.]|uniref:hypothetical protein n=1 Tax=Kouleothrix sp. TaxID=2779161 RepID=UPI002B6FB9E0|nr:hypothetical protein [Kouleothrix sp.]HRC75672.1 hypothetical protein [Kouleothrix sp.]